jgi:hypothetical protein
MKRFIPLLALFAAGMVVSFAIAAPPPGKGKPTSSSSTSTTHGKSGEHGKSQAKCRPMNLKGTVADGMVALNVTKADPHSSQLLNTTANLTVKSNVSVQAWSCGAASGASSTAPALFLRQLHVGGSPQQLGSTTGTTGTTAGQCRPSNLKGTVAGGTISLDVTKASGKNGKQLAGTTANLTVSGNASVQAWSCGATGSTGGSTAPQTLFLKQLHVGGSPHNFGSTTTTTGP